ncbi:hypothetical protein [Halomonas sp.]|uniref:hypothetical protein n=1 Tax=Halomonas sp. TaxID=1486246 RepID=UPI003D0C61A3
MKPTHIHSTHGTRTARIGTAQGEGQLAGQTLVIYLDLSVEPPATHYIEQARWEAEWREIPADACPVCHGSGTDQIKKRKDRPCGGCYGLGRVKADGETPKGEWEVAEVAGRIIEGLRGKLERANSGIEAMQRTPGVPEAIDAERERRRQAASNAQAEQERKWREGRGHGPGGARMTGD